MSLTALALIWTTYVSIYWNARNLSQREIWPDGIKLTIYIVLEYINSNPLENYFKLWCESTGFSKMSMFKSLKCEPRCRCYENSKHAEFRSMRCLFWMFTFPDGMIPPLQTDPSPLHTVNPVCCVQCIPTKAALLERLLVWVLWCGQKMWASADFIFPVMVS